MSETIVNRVAKSSIITIDLSEVYPKHKKFEIDISKWLYEGFILKEKEFRDSLKNTDWSNYNDSYVALYCSTDAIIPAWAYMLISTYLNPMTHKVIVGREIDLVALLFEDAITKMDISSYKDKPVIVKGCSDVKIPETAYLSLIKKLQPVVKSLMFGEACSAVPLYKPRK